MMHSYHSLFCRLCLSYDCHIHTDRIAPGKWASSNHAQPARVPKKACGDTCWMALSSPGNHTSAAARGGPDGERSGPLTVASAIVSNGSDTSSIVGDIGHVLSSRGHRMVSYVPTASDPPMLCTFCRNPAKRDCWKSVDGDECLCASCAAQDPYNLHIAAHRDPSAGVETTTAAAAPPRQSAVPVKYRCKFSNTSGACRARRCDSSDYCVMHTIHANGKRQSPWSKADTVLFNKLRTYVFLTFHLWLLHFFTRVYC